ncbi:MAG TPA: lipoate--protein ligase family protein [Candidatus Acidoferrum sp.]|nr:lipoate--protein ligase family protein [Candidatus Acidoferrum sp.]
MHTSLWRLLEHGPADGSWNMAVDEAMVQGVGEGRVPPTLRFYTWKRPTVSLGLLQRIPGGVDLTACERLAIPLVRRPTGGRAVLHAQELTYSVVAPLAGPWRALSVPETFGLVSRALILGLERLGITALVGDSGMEAADRDRTGACFLGRRMPAVLVDGRKLIGSAQRRFRCAMLQHGSILLDFDPALHKLVFPCWPRQEPSGGITHLHALLGTPPSSHALMQALAAGWQQALGAACLPAELTRDEAEAAARLVRERYDAPAWTFQR